MPPRQLTFWDKPDVDPTDRLKAAMREALRGCGMSREQVVDEMNKAAAREGLTTNGKSQKVSLATLDKWVSAGARAHRVPVQFLPLFCLVTNSLLPLTALAAPLSARVIDQNENQRLAWAEAEIERKRAASRARKLSQEIGL